MPKDRRTKSQKRDEKLFHELQARKEPLNEVELDQLLEDEGIDVAESRRCINTLAREAADAYRRDGKPAPRFLENLSRAMRDDLPAPTSIVDARREAASWAESIGRAPRVSTGPCRLAEAARSKGDAQLSEADRKLLEEQRRLLQQGDDGDDDEH